MRNFCFLLQEKRTPLHHASREGRVKEVQLLLERGAVVDAIDWVCYTTESLNFNEPCMAMKTFTKYMEYHEPIHIHTTLLESVSTSCTTIQYFLSPGI